MSKRADTVLMGVAGLGGYAESVTDVVREMGLGCDPPVRLHAVCDPASAQFAKRVALLESEEVAVFDDFDALLAEPIDAVWLPIPIPLHRPFTERALAAGKAVICEKPAAGTIDEVDAMIAARDRAGLPVAIGFQDIHDPETMTLKRRLLAGDFGRVSGASVVCCWPRDTNYFGRNHWAGRLKVGDTWVLDSPVNNAMAHFIALPLFLLGQTPTEAAQPSAIEAELYRAADIENYDTASLRVELEGGIDLRVYYTHACDRTYGPRVTIHTDRGKITWDTGVIVAEWDGQSQTIERKHPRHHAMLQRFARAIRGIDDPQVALATLEVARAHTLVVNGASQAAPIRPIPFDATASVTTSRNGLVATIAGIEEAMRHAAEARQDLHTTKRLAFTVPPVRLDLRGYRHFEGVPTLGTLA